MSIRMASRLLKKTHRLRCARSPRFNVLAMYASARRIFARLASEIFLSSLQSELFSTLLGYGWIRGHRGSSCERSPLMPSQIGNSGLIFDLRFPGRGANVFNRNRREVPGADGDFDNHEIRRPRSLVQGPAQLFYGLDPKTAAAP
jgi:hypothetical protein